MSSSYIPSPRKPHGSGPPQHPHLMSATYSNWKSSRKALGTELEKKQVFDSPRVLARLGVSQVPAALVAECRSLLFQEHETTLKALLELIRCADNVPLHDLEPSSNDQEELTKQKRRREKAMYPYLRKIFQCIEDFTSPMDPSRYPSPPLHRQFLNDPKYLTQDAHIWGFPKGAPDFSLIDLGVKSTLWRERVAFVEVKPSSKQGPKPVRQGSDDAVLSLVTQCADYARLHMSAKPFQLFSVGLLIFGTKFCVGIFDRDGVEFSPIQDLWDNTDDFIRIVRRMACDMSLEDLGQDPTAIELPSESVEARAAATLAHQLKVERTGHEYPSYSVSMGGHDTRRWCTVGPPIWSSLSFIGRGTSIWRVAEVKAGRLSTDVVVMKSAWRSSKRLSESIIYKSIKGKHPGIAKHSFGDDVRLASGTVISVDALRGCFLDGKETPILHRLFLDTIGRPIWDYTSELELLRGILGAMEGHRFLLSQGFLHRDVSAGNVMLPLHSSIDGCHGFLTDMEFALMTESQITIPVSCSSGKLFEPTRTHCEPQKLVSHCAVMTGTVQFMAVAILTDILRREYNTARGRPPIIHAAAHDIESFCWVLCYSVGRHLYASDPSIQDMIWNWFTDCFMHTNLTLIRNCRAAGQPLELPMYAWSHMSMPLVQLFDTLHSVLSRHARNSTLGYDDVADNIERAITEIEQESA